MVPKNSSIKEDRLTKLEELKKSGVNPYPSTLDFKRLPISTILSSEGKVVGVAGRVAGWRLHGNVIFADIVDESGKIQAFFQKKVLNEDFKLLKLVDLGDFVAVQGKIIRTIAGEISVDVAKFQLLSKAVRPLPSKWYGLKDIEERYRRRYVDLLLSEKVRKVFDTRSKLVSEIRKYMEESGFIEVETPVLQPIYGGASAAPFITHHNALDIDLYLRISDELYLKRLIVGGYEKVYEIGKVFRNEGVDRAHNPEFTMMEFYWAFANYETLMKFTEGMLSTVIKKVTGSLIVKNGEDTLDFTPPWPRVTFRDLLLRETKIDINKVNTEEKLKDAIKENGLKLDLKDVIGLGALYDKLYKEFVRPKIIQPTLLLDYPVEMIALAKRKESDPGKIASFQLLAKGYELIKAYNELNDPKDQKDRWLEEENLGEKGLKEHMVLDEDYIQALEYGMPPTAGWGMGIDRLTAILTGQHSLKETILFPTLRPEK